MQIYQSQTLHIFWILLQTFLFVSRHKISNRIMVNRICGHLRQQNIDWNTNLFWERRKPLLSTQKHFQKQTSIRVAAGTEGETVVTNRPVGLRGPRLALTLLVLPVWFNHGGPSNANPDPGHMGQPLSRWGRSQEANVLLNVSPWSLVFCLDILSCLP